MAFSGKELAKESAAKPGEYPPAYSRRARARVGEEMIPGATPPEKAIVYVPFRVALVAGALSDDEEPSTLGRASLIAPRASSHPLGPMPRSLLMSSPFAPSCAGTADVALTNDFPPRVPFARPAFTPFSAMLLARPEMP